MSQNEHRVDPEDIAARAEELLLELDESTPQPSSPPLDASEPGSPPGRNSRPPVPSPSPTEPASRIPPTTATHAGLPLSFLLGSMTGFVVMVRLVASLNRTASTTSGSSSPGRDLAPAAKGHRETSIAPENASTARSTCGNGIGWLVIGPAAEDLRLTIRRDYCADGYITRRPAPGGELPK